MIANIFVSISHMRSESNKHVNLCKTILTRDDSESNVFWAVGSSITQAIHNNFYIKSAYGIVQKLSSRL